MVINTLNGSMEISLLDYSKEAINIDIAISILYITKQSIISI